MKVLTSQQIKALDSFTILNEPISSIDLMERASKLCVDWINQHYNKCSFTLVCGEGNNGGDGFAIARLLLDMGLDVSVIALSINQKRSHDCELNYDRLLLKHPESVAVVSRWADLNIKGEVIIDAIFGNGLSRPVEGELKSIIDHINQSNKPVISVDLPSGLNTDGVSYEGASVIKAKNTLTFQNPKLCLLLPENTCYVGTWHIIDIGLSESFVENLDTPFFVSQKETLKKILAIRSAESHKGNYGHSLIIAGSNGKIGAALLSVNACLHSGTGLLSALIPECGYDIIQSNVPEAMVLTSKKNHIGGSLPKARFNAVGVGPGLGTESETKEFIRQLITSTNYSLVLDADALNCLSEMPDLLSNIPSGTVLTPHPKEFDRLFGTHSYSYDRIQTMRCKAQELKATIILKGQYTAVCSPDGDVWFNITGNPGMATGGSGDVLTGVITALIAQGISSFDAARLGVYLHGLAADIALNEQSEESLSATNIIHSLGKAFKYYHE